MSSLGWYWDRLRAMDTVELGARCRKKVRAMVDQRLAQDWRAISLEVKGTFPRLPDKAAAPLALREALQRDARAILDGKWTLFGNIPVAVDRPPRWHCDYLVGKDLSTEHSAFVLNHRALPGGADIKVIWELSRWFQLVRLAQAGWLLEDKEAVTTCVHWLRDWVKINRPFVGWNWTSALESGLRLVQFTWLHALLLPVAERFGCRSEIEQLQLEVLPPHVWFTWRHKSFGSSANNHLLGELSGLIVATSRWPALEHWGAPLDTLQDLWEREVLAQFAEDGGNREQALNYHLFSLEFAWQARLALEGAGLKCSQAVRERMDTAGAFFLDVQVDADPWDYGDSDSAYVTPLFAEEKEIVQEWRRWLANKGSVGLASPLAPALSPLRGEGRQSAVGFWLGTSDGEKVKDRAVEACGWRIYPQSGIAIRQQGEWTLRWDLSPLGYLSTAAHGHLDALHLSIWFQKRAIVIDPGTGAYYADKQLRNYLSSWAAHNGPRIEGANSPRRAGPFLWSQHHEPPQWRATADGNLFATLNLKGARIQRTISRITDRNGWTVEDTTEFGERIFVRWQFHPACVVRAHSANMFCVQRDDISLWVEVGKGGIATLCGTDSMAGICSPSFRRIERGPYLDVESSSHKPCVLRTSFLASPPS